MTDPHVCMVEVDRLVYSYEYSHNKLYLRVYDKIIQKEIDFKLMRDFTEVRLPLLPRYNEYDIYGAVRDEVK